jgi:hyaluronan synthase
MTELEHEVGSEPRVAPEPTSALAPTVRELVVARPQASAHRAAGAELEPQQHPRKRELTDPALRLIEERCAVGAEATLDSGQLIDDRPWERSTEGTIGRGMRWAAALTTAAVCGLLVWHVTNRLGTSGFNRVGSFYTILISLYFFSRFVFAALYRPPRDAGLEPSISIVVPAYNEGASVAHTIHACLGVDYPAEKLEMVVINDGSSDDTWEHMRRAAACYPEGSVRCIDLGRNCGKRAAMAEGIRRTTAEILVFIDSDSLPAPKALRKLVQGFADPKVAAISGLTYVRNADATLLTRMQAARYYVSFQLLKAAESIVGAVSCCSGCFAAYRREAVLPLLERWEHQHFLGVACTYGDDRALTNMILRSGWKAVYDSEAEAWTDAPEHYRKFFKQQLRWKKSWAREGPILCTHLWRTRPIAFPWTLFATLAGLLSPIVVLYNVGWQPFARETNPTFYILCFYLISACYALIYRALRADGLWKFAVLSTFFYVSLSVQLFWAIAHIRDGSWGTRALDSTAKPDLEFG